MEWLQKIDLRFGRIGRKKFFVMIFPVWIVFLMLLFFEGNINKSYIESSNYFFTALAVFFTSIFSIYLSLLRFHDMGVPIFYIIPIIFLPHLASIFSETFAGVINKGIFLVYFIVKSSDKGDKYGESDNDWKNLFSMHKRIGRINFFFLMLWCIGIDDLIRGCYNINVINGNVQFAFIMLGFMLSNMIFWCAMYCLRIHDIGKNGNLFSIVFICLYLLRRAVPQLWPSFWGYVILSILYLLLVKGDNEENEYGMPPTTIPWMKK